MIGWKINYKLYI